ncbi:hypothetical protein RchiOBHm_Chr7g0236571 [Rosa chinensis]|uniref:Uncharacterized protein n=1 Tax=Rosa chinensis TaxID=74649 RepID=A0A2P6PGZ4_ROSCH|nr:hypothetical protein RchiOBHm_Chr7g0236571 [Rosa chinensis]
MNSSQAYESLSSKGSQWRRFRGLGSSDLNPLVLIVLVFLYRCMNNTLLPINLRSGHTFQRLPRQRPRNRSRTPPRPRVPPRNPSPSPIRSPVREMAERPIREFSRPSMTNTASCLVLPDRDVDFEIKLQQLSILPIFRGMPSEKAINHMQDFEAIVSTMSKGGLPEATTKEYTIMG